MTDSNRNIKDELARIAPELAPILAKDSGFRVPDRYFAENPEKMISLARIRETDRKESPFRVPDDYFETLSERLQSRISTEEGNEDLPSDYFENLPSAILQKIRKEEQSDNEKASGRIINLQIRRALAVAALISGLAFAIWAIVNKPSVSPEKQISEVSTSELENYLSDQIEYLNDDELSSILSTDSEYLPASGGTDTDEGEFEDYLENVDLTTIEDIL